MKNASLVTDLEVLSTYVFDYVNVYVDVDDQFIAPFFELLHNKFDELDEVIYFQVNDYVIAGFGNCGIRINSIYFDGEIVDFLTPCMINTMEFIMLLRGIDVNFFVNRNTIMNLDMVDVGRLCSQLPNVDPEFLEKWFNCYISSCRMDEQIKRFEKPYLWENSR